MSILLKAYSPLPISYVEKDWLHLKRIMSIYREKPRLKRERSSKRSEFMIIICCGKYITSAFPKIHVVEQQVLLLYFLKPVTIGFLSFTITRMLTIINGTVPNTGEMC